MAGGGWLIYCLALEGKKFYCDGLAMVRAEGTLSSSG
jgi:hypothetical protein